MKPSLILVMIAAALAIPAAASAAPPKPTPAAISHWQKTALKPPLSAWWKGYLQSSQTGLSSCTWMKAGRQPFYDCQIKLGGTVLGFAALVRTARCAYTSELVDAKNQHTFMHRFRFCG